MRKRIVKIAIAGLMIVCIAGCGKATKTGYSVEIPLEEDDNILYTGALVIPNSGNKDTPTEEASGSAEIESSTETSVEITNNDEPAQITDSGSTSSDSFDVYQPAASDTPVNEPAPAAEPEPEPTPEPEYVNTLLRNYGSYENFEALLFDEINNLRKEGGYSVMTRNSITDEICRTVNELGVSVGTTKHWTALDYPQLYGMYRGAESCAYGDVEMFADVKEVAYHVSYGHTKKIVTDPDNIFLAVSVIPYTTSRGREQLSITVTTWNTHAYYDCVIGDMPWTTFDSSGRSIEERSIYSK